MKVRAMVLCGGLALVVLAGCSSGDGADAKPWDTCEATVEADASLDSAEARADAFSTCIGEEGYVCGTDEANPTDCQKETSDGTFEVVTNPFATT